MIPKGIVMNQIIVGPVLQHLRMIGLDGGAILLATAFYSSRALLSLPIRAESVTVICRLDLHSTEEWKRGLIAPDALLSFLKTQQGRGTATRLHAAPTAHAKVYLGSRAVLIGSANLTLRGFGGGHEVLNRLESRQALRMANRALREYQDSLREIGVNELQDYVERNQPNVHRVKTRRTIQNQKPDQLPRAQRSAWLHLGSYDNFLDWLNSAQAAGALEIWGRARGKHNLSGHIHRNFYGLRQFFLAYPEVFETMKQTNPDTYKLSKDATMEQHLSGFVSEFATDEDDFSLDHWRTYLGQ